MDEGISYDENETEGYVVFEEQNNRQYIQIKSLWSHTLTLNDEGVTKTDAVNEDSIKRLGLGKPVEVKVNPLYRPYVPLIQTPVVLDPESYTPSKGILTKYSKKLIREADKYYKNITFKFD